jgi:hypothetical protein
MLLRSPALQPGMGREDKQMGDIDLPAGFVPKPEAS